MTVSDEIRKVLVQRCGSRRTRTSVFTAQAPTEWQPRTVRDPSRPTEFFTDDGAWQFIADAIVAGAPIEVMTLEHPPGKTGYVLKLAGCLGEVIYIKLQIGSSTVIGRSFHVSKLSGKRP